MPKITSVAKIPSTAGITVPVASGDITDDPTPGKIKYYLINILYRMKE